MHRRDVIVVVVGQTAVPAVEVELTNFVGDRAPVVAGIENRDAIRADRDGAALEVARRNWNGRGRGRGHQRQTPDVGLAKTDGALIALGIGGRGEIRCRHRNLLLPRNNPHHERGHERGIRDIVRLHVKRRGIVVRAHARFEGAEGRRHRCPVTGRRRSRRQRRGSGAFRREHPRDLRVNPPVSVVRAADGGTQRGDQQNAAKSS